MKIPPLPHVEVTRILNIHEEPCLVYLIWSINLSQFSPLCNTIIRTILFANIGKEKPNSRGIPFDWNGTDARVACLLSRGGGRTVEEVSENIRDGWTSGPSIALNWCNSCKDAQLENPSRLDPIQLLSLLLLQLHFARIHELATVLFGC